MPRSLRKGPFIDQHLMKKVLEAVKRIYREELTLDKLPQQWRAQFIQDKCHTISKKDKYYL